MLNILLNIDKNIGTSIRIDKNPRESVNFKVECLSSLKTLSFGVKNADDISIRNLPWLKELSLNFSGEIDNGKITRILDQVPNIQELNLEGNLSYFNLDSFVNLRVLSLSGDIEKNFNLELFKNLCNQLEDIKISIGNLKKKTFMKLFDGYNFPYLVDLTIEFLDMYRLKKEFIN